MLGGVTQTSAGPTAAAPRGVEAIDLMAGVLASMDAGAEVEEVLGSVAEEVCRLTGTERAIVFHFDADLRQVRAVAAHGVPLELFRTAYVTPDTAPVARRSLEEDAVQEVVGDDIAALMPAEFAGLLAGRRLTSAPMAASGRWLGVVLVDRPADQGPLSADARELLWAIGKALALALMARGAVRATERARTLEQRVDLARQVHDGVVQRLFGVGMALDGDGDLPAELRRRCATELQAAQQELRELVAQPLGRPARAAHLSFAEEVERLARAHEDLDVRFAEDAPVPPGLEPLAQGVLAEAVRNARKHAAPTRIDVRTSQTDDAVVVEVLNDGVAPTTPSRVGTGGVGLRLAAFEALQQGGVLEFGPRGQDGWQVRLVVGRA